MNSGAKQTLQRYAVPGFVVTVFHYLKTKAVVSPAARIQLTRRVTFGSGTVVKSYVVVQTSGGMISFGRECALSSFDHISAGEGDIVVGDYVRIAPNCTIVGGRKEIPGRDSRIMDQPESEPNGVTIGDDVLIGAGTVILPGSNIGRGAVIGAGSIVRGDVSEFAIAVGRPVRIIGERK